MTHIGHSVSRDGFWAVAELVHSAFVVLLVGCGLASVERLLAVNGKRKFTGEQEDRCHSHGLTMPIGKTTASCFG
jgi:hypothetical protein